MLENTALFYGTNTGIKNVKDVKNISLDIKRKLNNIQLLVIRIGGNGKNNFINSKPCKHCINYMKTLGIRKVYYSDDNGDIIYEKISNMQSEHISMLRKQYT